jgi:ubiquinone/menaquinone biosynthesis C-methylase UbiE
LPAKVALPLLEEYQARFVNNVRRVIETNWFRRRPKIRILDMGCDTSGRQLAHLAALPRGEVVGINIPDNFPTQPARETGGNRTTLIRMDGTNLTFPENSFDLVISANVIEHVGDLKKYVSECARILKPSGIAYLETAPVWSGPRGHHVHPDMIAENCPTETDFRDDGSVVPHWGHLLLNEPEMRMHLQALLNPNTVNYICHYIYHSSDLNRVPWSGIKLALEEHFPYCRISPLLADSPNQPALRSSNEDHRVHGFTAVCGKREPNPIAHRFTSLLRRLGL